MKQIIRVITGVFIGIAILIPGVSGGTMAIILDVYDDIIESISNLFNNLIKNTVTLFEISIGIIIGIIVVSSFLYNLIINYGMEMQYLFIGAIVGGLPTLINKTNEFRKVIKKDYVYFLIGFFITQLMTIKPSTIISLTTNGNLMSIILLFIAGIILAVALILPGISGSFMLLVLGLYDTTLNAINNHVLIFLMPLIIGILVGTFLTSKIINICLHRHSTPTYMLILGFVLGSLLSIFPGFPIGYQWITLPIIFMIGFIPIYILGKNKLAE